MHCRIRYRSDAGLLHLKHYFGVQLLQCLFRHAARIIAIPNNIYAGLGGQFQIRVRFNQAGQIVCLGDVLIDQTGRIFGHHVPAAPSRP